MITASHNPIEDNGVKIVDPDGDMLAPDWEPIAEDVVNLLTTPSIDFICDTGTIIIGRDTRPHSEKFAQLVQLGAQRYFSSRNQKIEFIDLGLVTTPQLHFTVYSHNNVPKTEDKLYGYTKRLASAVKTLLSTGARNKTKQKLLIDCAGGIGALATRAVAIELIDSIEFVLMNEPGTIELNRQCGAEFVQKCQKSPRSNLKCENTDLSCSFDGDADRVVFFYRDKKKLFSLLDGDKIAFLFIRFLKKEIDALQIQNLHIGIVQTAYANGASTIALKKENIPVIMTRTGVKHLHRAAHDNFDIGVYFEANGHGTVLFSSKFYSVLNSLPSSIHKTRLLAFASLANQTVGDALADALLVLCVLHLLEISIQQWHSMYTDLPNLTTKVSVQDRSILETNHDDSRLIQPARLQAAIDQALLSFPSTSTRAFVRPSGTEDVVRVYAEAPTLSETRALNLTVAQAVFDLAHGTGTRPSSSSVLP